MKTSEVYKVLIKWARGIAKELGGRLDVIEVQEVYGVGIKYIKNRREEYIHIDVKYLDMPLQAIQLAEQEQRIKQREAIEIAMQKLAADKEAKERKELARLQKKYKTN